ncbi:MAG: helix-turn-helix transcriptional regulator [Planctomycetes bacterium]|nr:helix-turn-helix transcriptional regulator [Planctomycetota bacterium]
MRGTLRASELPAVRKDGHRVVLVGDFALVGAGGEVGLLLVVKEWRQTELVQPPRFQGDEHYEISVSGGEFGRVRRHWGPSATEGAAIGDVCHRALFGREQPCEGCPALRVTQDEPEYTAVVRSTRADEGSFHIVSAQARDDATVLISVRSISELLLGDLVQARLAEIAERKGLSEREREVLNLLVLGRSADEIAKILGISPRTVKFHQANVLEKLGADTRLDLLREIF